MADKTAISDISEEGGRGPRGRRPTREVAERLRQAIKAAGGNKHVAEASGVPLNTINGYLRGVGLSFAAAAALSKATGVTMEWLATGRGPMRPGQATPSSAVMPASPFRLFGNVDLDRLRRAIEGATASAGGDDRLLLHLIVVLYDQLSERDETQPPPPP